MTPTAPDHTVVNSVSTTHTLSDFDFVLPEALIAQHPAPERSGSRLLDSTVMPSVDRIFRELPTLLRAGDLLVFNDTKVVNARLFGNKPPPRSGPGVALPTGGKVELLVERVLGGNQVAAHMRVSKKPEVGATLKLVCAPGKEDGLSATLLGSWPDADGPLFRFVLSNDAGDDPYTLMERHGHVPLPPYITHSDSADDALRYQTVFAKNPGAVAAPTAALHFDQALAVGTTTVRTLESWAHSGVARGDTRIFITPGFEFKLIDLLVTNFHLPKSSLMMLVSAFAGYAHIMALYQTAISREYRFFSYGDAMLLARPSVDRSN